MDFSKFEAVENSNTRKAGGKSAKRQLFTDLKYRKAPNKKTGVLESRFIIAKAKFDELDIANHALRQFTAPDGSTLLGVVGDEDGKILKASKRGAKTHGFKSTKLEVALNALKIIDTSKISASQYVDLVLEGENVAVHKINCIKVFSFKVGQELPKESKTTPIEAAIKEEKAKGPSLESTIKTAGAAAEPVTAGVSDEWN